MKNINYTTFNDPSELSPHLQSLLTSTEEALHNAHSPYSKLKVGAAIILDNLEIITGSNQESPIFPLGLCAERVALFTYGNQNRKEKIKYLAVTSDEIPGKTHPLFPCGSCRQSILDFELRQNSDIGVIIFNKNEIYCFQSVRELLPFSIDNRFLS